MRRTPRKRLTPLEALRLPPRPVLKIEAVTRYVPQAYLPPVAVSVPRVKFLERGSSSS
jgi:hypothetical protein